VLLGDGDDVRVIEAAEKLSELRLTVLVLALAGATHLRQRLSPEITIVTPTDVDRESMQLALESDEASVDSVLADGPALAGALMRLGVADTCIVGTSYSSPHVLRALLKNVGPASPSSIVSSTYIMELTDGRAFGYGDCVVNPTPTADELGQIAAASARTYRTLVGEPFVALLSFSTQGSANDPSVRRVREAVVVARDQEPQTAFDGELQLDAAVDPSVAAIKAPLSLVAGRANVLVFPDLNAGNIAYKLTERLAGARAYGPVLEGLACSAHDISRGSTPEDVVSLAVMTAALERRRTTLATTKLDDHR
jgi:phosphotransacetylase